MVFPPARPVETAYSATKLRYNNAAGRIYEVVRRLRNGKPDIEMMRVWWKALELESRFAFGNRTEHRLLLFEYLQLLARQLDQVEIEAKLAFPQDTELYILHFPEFRSVLAPEQTQVNWSHYAARLTPGIVSDLGHCAKDLPKEEAIGIDELTIIYNQIEDLKKAIHTANKLDAHLRDWLVYLTTSMQKAIDEYELCGGRAFEKVLANLIGATILHGQALASAKQQAPDVVGGFKGLVRTFVDLAQKTKLKAGALVLAGMLVQGSIGRIGERITDGVFDAGTDEPNPNTVIDFEDVESFEPNQDAQSNNEQG